MRFNHVHAVIVVAVALAAQPACWWDSDKSDALSRQDCERLRDHLIDLRMQSVTADHDQHRIALRSALDDSFITSCTESTTSEHLKCALAAKNSDALLACSDPIAPTDPAFAGDPTSR